MGEELAVLGDIRLSGKATTSHKILSLFLLNSVRKYSVMMPHSLASYSAMAFQYLPRNKITRSSKSSLAEKVVSCPPAS
jgi:hypothetical protein